MPFPSEFAGYLGLLTCGGVFFIVYGLIYILAKGPVWKLQAMFSRVRRKDPPERTPEWSRRTTASGVVALFFGLFALFFAVLVPALLSSFQQNGAP